MAAHVVGMDFYADGGRMATKPCAAGGAYLNGMTDHCKARPYSPSTRVGATACPFTAGYWISWTATPNTSVATTALRSPTPASPDSPIANS
jgi:deoxyribodipyrimidine photolyase-like uncharacterized protein